MLPTTFEFRWDAGHMIFFGVFYAVVIVVLTSLFFVVAKSITDLYRTMKAGNGRPDIVSEPEAETGQDETEVAAETRTELSV